ncbi:MAG TPA: HAMP domain-containing sensor histidine kinase, partial [Caldilineaceae bacterium]|nr:HAMP domain-containing sensor histidine kinase [Caldilineaceae bacterium]
LPPMNRRGMMPGNWAGAIVSETDEKTGVVTIHRFPGMFGSRLEFNDIESDEPPVRRDDEESLRRPRQVWQLIYGEDETPPPLPVSDLVVTLPIGDPAAPTGFVELSGGPDFVSESLRSVRRSFGVAGLGAGLLAVIVGLLVSRGLTAPILSLGDAARRMGEGDLTARAPLQSSDEIGQVAASFNRMAEGLQSSFAELEAERDALRRFVADASHELRTPITALKSFNELLAGPAANDPAAQTEFLAESAVQVARLEWITANLLDLSRLDGRLVALDLADHDLAELIEEVAAPFYTLAGERGIGLTARPLAEPLTLTCDRVRMVMALSNLLDNGLKYCAAGDEVEIGAAKEGGMVRLWVADSGPGIDEEEQRHIFERFYRGRTRAADG